MCILHFCSWCLPPFTCVYLNLTESLVPTEPCICCLPVFYLVTANLGDSLAGLTVFSSNEEDPYVTLKDTVSALNDYVHTD